MENQNLNNEVVLMDTLLRVKSLQSLLIKKNIITEDELLDELTSHSKPLLEAILNQANVSIDVDAIIQNMKNSIKSTEV